MDTYIHDHAYVHGHMCMDTHTAVVVVVGFCMLFIFESFDLVVVRSETLKCSLILVTFCFKSIFTFSLSQTEISPITWHGFKTLPQPFQSLLSITTLQADL